MMYGKFLAVLEVRFLFGCTMMYPCLIQKTCEFSALEAYQELEDFRQETVIKHGNGQFPIAPFADDFPIVQCPN
jgi:hypothetical protein